MSEFRNNLTAYRGPIEFITATEPPATITAVPAQGSAPQEAVNRPLVPGKTGAQASASAGRTAVPANAATVAGKSAIPATATSAAKSAVPANAAAAGKIMANREWLTHLWVSSQSAG
ncbi:MAG: hypothetical protein R2758_17340 [Bacteroidales bacterium]